MKTFSQTDKSTTFLFFFAKEKKKFEDENTNYRVEQLRHRHSPKHCIRKRASPVYTASFGIDWF